MSSLVQASDGTFLGTAFAGGANNMGIIFKIASDGTFAMLHTFSGLDGKGPSAGLVQSSDGNYYGTTSAGELNGSGTIFKITLSGGSRSARMARLSITDCSSKRCRALH